MARWQAASALATLLLMLLAPSLALAAHHEGEKPKESPRKAWDKERMTELSSQLATATAEVRRAFRAEPNFRNPQTPNQRAVHQMEQTLRNLEITTRRLGKRVRAGGDHDDTVGIARRIGMLLNDADMLGNRIMTSAFMAEKIQPAMKLINEIAPYYGRGPLYDPATMKRVDGRPNPASEEAQE